MKKLAMVAITLALASAAQAGLDTSNAYDDGTFTWTGTTVITGTFGQVEASVQWCVDAPVAGVFKYKYQVTPTAGSSVVSSFGVGMFGSNEATGIGSAAIAAGEIAPVDMDLVVPESETEVGQAEWTFSALADDEVSEGLFYSSVNAPRWGIGSIQDSGDGGTGLVPTPDNVIPEPATMSLLALGGLALIRRRK